MKVKEVIVTFNGKRIFNDTVGEYISMDKPAKITLYKLTTITPKIDIVGYITIPLDTDTQEGVVTYASHEYRHLLGKTLIGVVEALASQTPAIAVVPVDDLTEYQPS